MISQAAASTPKTMVEISQTRPLIVPASLSRAFILPLWSSNSSRMWIWRCSILATAMRSSVKISESLTPRTPLRPHRYGRTPPRSRQRSARCSPRPQDIQARQENRRMCRPSRLNFPSISGSPHVAVVWQLTLICLPWRA